MDKDSENDTDDMKKMKESQEEQMKEMVKFLCEYHNTNFSQIPLIHNVECNFYREMNKCDIQPLPIPTIYGWQTMTTCDEPGLFTKNPGKNDVFNFRSACHGRLFCAQRRNNQYVRWSYDWASGKRRRLSGWSVLMND